MPRKHFWMDSSSKLNSICHARLRRYPWNGASIDRARKQVSLKPWEEVEVTFVGSKVWSLPSIISAISVKKLITSGNHE
jgi:hypothetical protein